MAKKAAKKKVTKSKPRALIVWGGWKGHEPEQCAAIFEPWLKKKGFNVVVSDTMDIYTNKRKMKNFDVVLPIWTMGQIEGPQERGLLAAVKEGVGVAGWHGGMCDAFRNNVTYQFMTGGQWVAHPGGIIKYKVNITDVKSPVTKGLKDFFITSEQYYMHTDPGNKVLATTTFTCRHGDSPWVRGTVMPVTWQRMWGKGRVAYTSLGHVAKDFDIPEVLEMTKRNILWAARQPITVEYTSK